MHTKMPGCCDLNGSFTDRQFIVLIAKSQIRCSKKVSTPLNDKMSSISGPHGPASFYSCAGPADAINSVGARKFGTRKQSSAKTYSPCWRCTWARSLPHQNISKNSCSHRGERILSVYMLFSGQPDINSIICVDHNTNQKSARYEDGLYRTVSLGPDGFHLASVSRFLY